MTSHTRFELHSKKGNKHARKIVYIAKYVLSELLFSVNRANINNIHVYLHGYIHDIGTFLLFLVAHRKGRCTNV